MKSLSKIFAMLALGMFLSACGGGSDSNEKSLFSLWKRTSDGMPVDMSGGSFSSPGIMNFYTNNGSRCQCELIVIGDNVSGAGAVSSCKYVVGTSTRNPGCGVFNGTYRYSVTGDTLTLVDPSGYRATYK